MSRTSFQLALEKVLMLDTWNGTLYSVILLKKITAIKAVGTAYCLKASSLPSWDFTVQITKLTEFTVLELVL